MRVLKYLALLAGAALAGPAFALEPLQVTVLVSFEQPHSSHTLRQMETQIHRVLSGTGISLALQERSEFPPGAEFRGLVIFTMKGRCSMEPLPVGALSDERGPLAMAYSSDGKVLPFGEVQCDTVRTSLERVLGKQQTRAYQSLFDNALANVMAHEIYHMLAGTAEHTGSGATKPGLTARELLDGRLALPDSAKLAIRKRMADLP